MNKKNVLIIGLICCLGFLKIYAQSSYSIAEGVKSHDCLFEASMKKGVNCYRIPSLVTAPNGDLIAAIDERVCSCGDLIWNKDINIVIRRSKNNGKSWKEIETVVDFPFGQSASDPSMIVDGVTGEIFLFYNYMDLEKAKGEFRLHYCKSKDNGKTWSKSVDITDQIAKPEWKKDFKFITSGRGIQTTDGRLLHTLVNLKNGMHIFGSDDHGKTWFCWNKALVPGNESKVVELDGGRILVNCRNNRQKRRYIHLTENNGKTWHSYQDEQLIDPGCNGSIIRYTSLKEGFDKNRLLFCNAKSEKGRSNLTIRISYDEGTSWAYEKTIYKGGSAYSSMTVLENGDLAVFFEKDGYKKNEFVRFSLKWLTDGEDKYKKPTKKKRKTWFF